MATDGRIDRQTKYLKNVVLKKIALKMKDFKPNCHQKELQLPTFIKVVGKVVQKNTERQTRMKNIGFNLNLYVVLKVKFKVRQAKSKHLKY